MTLSLQGKPRPRQAILIGSAILTTIVAALAALSLLQAGAADPPQPTYEPGFVDGNSIEWEQGDLFAPVFPEGDAAGSAVGSIYARYDCSDGVLYVLFLTIAGYTIDTSAGAGQLTLDGAILASAADSPPDGSPPDFALINLGDIAVGFEASAAVAPGAYTTLGVQAALTNGAVSVANNAIELVIDCDGSGETAPTVSPTEPAAEEPTIEGEAEGPAAPSEGSVEGQQVEEEATATPTGEAPTSDPGVGAQQEQEAEPTATQAGSPGAPTAGTGLTAGRDLTPLLIVLGGWVLVALGFTAEFMRRRLESGRL